MNRKEKINLLRGILKGNQSINEIPDKISLLDSEIWFSSETSDEIIYENSRTHEILTKEQFEKLYGKFHITFK
jgi:hypothetical protein